MTCCPRTLYSYSEPCAALLALAPGGNIANNKIVTTDLLGGDGLDTVRRMFFAILLLCFTPFSILAR